MGIVRSVRYKTAHALLETGDGVEVALVEPNLVLLVDRLLHEPGRHGALGKIVGVILQSLAVGTLVSSEGPARPRTARPVPVALTEESVEDLKNLEMINKM